jgi:hypothetical protein
MRFCLVMAMPQSLTSPRGHSLVPHQIADWPIRRNAHPDGRGSI